MKIRKGFSAVETIAALGILVIMVAVVLTALKAANSRSQLNSLAIQVENALKLARDKSFAFEQGGKFGIFFDASSAPQKMVLFAGNDYASRNASSDISYEICGQCGFLADFSGFAEVVFYGVGGNASPSGQVLASFGNESKSIFVSASGEIEFSPSSPAPDSRIKDSRHTHFSFGWNMQNITRLKFFFPDLEITETVDAASYFNSDKSSFSWEGDFFPADQPQSFEIHTHLLSATQFPFTLLCVHRDRNNGINGQDVIIYLADGGVDKEIASFIGSSVLAGPYGGTVFEQ